MQELGTLDERKIMPSSEHPCREDDACDAEWVCLLRIEDAKRHVAIRAARVAELAEYVDCGAIAVWMIGVEGAKEVIYLLQCKRGISRTHQRVGVGSFPRSAMVGRTALRVRQA